MSKGRRRRGRSGKKNFTGMCVRGEAHYFTPDCVRDPALCEMDQTLDVKIDALSQEGNLSLTVGEMARASRLQTCPPHRRRMMTASWRVREEKNPNNNKTSRAMKFDSFFLPFAQYTLPRNLRSRE